MAREKKNNKLASILFGPFLVVAGVAVLWENEGRFNFYQAARDATVIAEVVGADGQDTFAFTADLETDMPIDGHYVEGFSGFYRVTRDAEIYCWDRDEDDEGDVTWSKRWMSGVENNSRNNGIRKTLNGDRMFPQVYELGQLKVSPDDIHLVDSSASISPKSLTLTEVGKQESLRATNDVFFKGRGTPGNPQIGDERLEYRGIPNSPTASYFGAMQGELAGGKQFKISKSFISDFIQNDGVLHHIANGDRDQALATIKGYFAKVMWFTRLGGTVATVIGFWITLSSFLGLLYRIPILGQLIEWGAFLVSLVLGLLLSVTVILLSYAFHNPLLVIFVAAAIGAVVYFLRRRSQQTKQNVQTALHDYQLNHLDLGYELDSNDSGWSAGFAEHTFGKLAAIASLNGLSSKEIKFLKQWGEQNGISKSRVNELIESAESNASSVVADDRNDMTLFTCVALADGMLSTRELTTLKSIAKRMGMPASELDEIIAGVESGTLKPA